MNELFIKKKDLIKQISKQTNIHANIQLKYGA